MIPCRPMAISCVTKQFLSSHVVAVAAASETFSLANAATPTETPSVT